MLSQKNFLVETPIEQWPESWDELLIRLSPYEEKDKHFWKNLIISKMTAVPLEKDVESEYKAIFEIFWKEIRPQIINNPNGLIIAAENGLEIYIQNWLKKLPPEESKVLVNHHGPNSDTALHIAAKDGDILLTKTLIHHGADVNAIGNFSQVPLHYAAKENFPELITYLLKSGAVNTKQRNDGEMPIHVAVDSGKVEALNAFIDYDHAQLKSCANEARTPFYLAAMHGNIEIMQLLLDKGDNIKQFNPYSRHTVMHLAAIKDDPKVIEFLAEKNMDVNILDGSNRTPLQCAAIQKKPSVEAATALIAKRADVNAGSPPPYYLLAQNVGDNIHFGKRFADLLIQNGAEINPEVYGQTPFDPNTPSSKKMKL